MLLESGYDTPAYAIGWWRLDYYRDWKAGDEVVEKFPGVDRFAAIRERLGEARKTLAVFDAKIAEVDARIASVEGSRSERRNPVSSPPRRTSGRARGADPRASPAGRRATIRGLARGRPGLAGSSRSRAAWPQPTTSKIGGPLSERRRGSSR
jgi:hypothetical protein